MIYPTFITTATLLLIPGAYALPASYKHLSKTSMENLGEPKTLLGKSYILHQKYDDPQFTEDDNIHRNSPRNVKFPNIFYLPQRRDTTNDESGAIPTHTTVLSDQSVPPLPQNLLAM
jgi:hypothetical protein